MTLYLLPNTFSDDQPTSLLLAEGLPELIDSLDAVIGESERATRRYLIKCLQGSQKARDLPIHLLNEHTKNEEVKRLANLIIKSGRWGIVTDAGLPCVADPGSNLIAALHQQGYYSIQTVGGASSLIMALQLSGLSGQKFSFLGYLPRDEKERVKLICQKEKESREEKMTEMCIEAPYRSIQLMKELVETLSPTTILTLAQEVGTPNQSVQTKTVLRWRTEALHCQKVPSVFLWLGV